MTCSACGQYAVSDGEVAADEVESSEGKSEQAARCRCIDKIEVKDKRERENGALNTESLRVSSYRNG